MRLYICLLFSIASAANLRTLQLLNPEKTEWSGAGGNAYVIRFLKNDNSVGQSKGMVAKAFRSEEDRDEAYEELKNIPSLSVLAGLAYPTGTREDNTFHGP